MRLFCDLELLLLPCVFLLILLDCYFVFVALFPTFGVNVPLVLATVPSVVLVVAIPLYPIQEQDTIKDDQLDETCLDPSIDRITSTYTIDNQLKISEHISQPTFATITIHPDTSYHQYSQVPSIDYPDNVYNMTIRNTQPFISPSDRVSSTLPSNISLNLDVLQKTVRF